MSGRTIGDFEVVRELGRGGMGVVYEACQRGTQRRVAIKLLTAFDAEGLARFQQEALAAARINHPNAVAVHDFGVDQGRPYLVLELLEGETLKARLARGPLSEPELLRLAEGLGAALEAAHAQGVLHRDLKPENVILAPDGRAVLTDFGLARVVSESRERLTRSGDVLGTPAFMAPEQAEGRLNAIGVPTDVYGLGATLYAAAVGEAPFARHRGLTATLYAVLHAPVPPPRHARPDLSVRIEAVLLRSLAKTPSDRFASVGDLVAALHGDAPSPQSARLLVLGLAGALLGACAVGLLLARVATAPAAVDAADQASSRPQPSASPRASASPPRPSATSSAADASQPWASHLATIDAASDVGFLPNGDMITGGETLSRWSPPYTSAIGLSVAGQVRAVEILPGADPRIFVVTRREDGWSLLERSLHGKPLQPPLPLPADKPAALYLSPARDRLFLRADVSRLWMLDLRKDRRWVQLVTKHVNDVAFSPSAPHLALLLVGTYSLSFKNEEAVKPAAELWDFDQVPPRRVARLRLERGRPNLAVPWLGGGWLIGLGTGQVLRVDQDLSRVEELALERELIEVGFGIKQGIPIRGLAPRGRDRLVVASSHEDRQQAWLSLHARSPTGRWTRRERFELPGRTLLVSRCLLSPDGSTLALVLRNESESRCEVYRLR